MRMLTIAIMATAVLALSATAWNAQAQTWRGSADVKGAAQNFTPIHKAACGGRFGRHCGPGRHWWCGPRGYCRCVPC